MPSDTTSQTALIALAIAIWIQTLLLGALAVSAVVAWRRLEHEADRRYRDLVIRIDETSRPIRQTAESVQRMSDRASAAMDHASHLAGTARAWLAMPRNLATVGLATMASVALGRWRRQRKAPVDAPHVAPGTRAIH